MALSSLDMTLEEIIHARRSAKAAGGLRSDSIGVSPKGRISKQWKRPLFSKTTPPVEQWERFGPAGIPAAEAALRDAKVDISNLDCIVNTEDLYDLFGGFNLRSASVHYNEMGYSLGTASAVFATQAEAIRAINLFRGTRLDGKMLHMSLVGGVRVSSPRMRARTTTPRKRTSGESGRIASWQHDTTRFGQPAEDKEMSGGGGKGDGKERSTIGKRKVNGKLTEAELDAELDAYMKK